MEKESKPLKFCVQKYFEAKIKKEEESLEKYVSNNNNWDLMKSRDGDYYYVFIDKNKYLYIHTNIYRKLAEKHKLDMYEEEEFVSFYFKKENYFFKMIYQDIEQNLKNEFLKFKKWEIQTALQIILNGILHLLPEKRHQDVT